jgi:hypothetical protein
MPFAPVPFADVFSAEFPEHFDYQLNYATARGRRCSMSGDRSRARRRLAAECLAMAKQASDATARAFLVEMAWKWLDLAELDEWDNWEKACRSTFLGARRRDRIAI